MVLAISSERILGSTLKNVPDAVPTRREILVSIFPFVILNEKE
jgi:hypothetical protein